MAKRIFYAGKLLTGRWACNLANPEEDISGEARRSGGIYDVVKVLDFGLVKEVTAAAEAKITAVNEVLGMPYYMAPK